MGCGSTADLLLGAGGMGGKWAEDGAEGGGAMEHVGVVAGFLDVIT